MASEQRSAILAYLARVPDACAADLADALGFSLPAASMHLLRLTRSGLARRTFDPRHGRYFHEITAKGRERLKFLQEGID
jgi:DNA-binding MarR family transcriptional regulator